MRYARSVTAGLLYHIASAEEWMRASADGHYAPASLHREGFVHLSTAAQLPGTRERFFAGRDGLVLLAIRPADLAAPLRYEEADGDLFPHLYGPLNLDAVAEVTPLGDDLPALP